MTLDMYITLAILLVAIILFVTEWLRIDMVAIGVVVTLMLTNILTTKEALAGFSNAAVLAIAALFMVGGAVMQTGLAGLIGKSILKIAGTSEIRLLVVIMVAVAILSSFMSSTGTVAVLLPAIIALANSAKVAPSKLLIPLSFGSLLGGAMTLIGTPPNIIVSDVLAENGLRPFSFFEYTPAGLPLLIAGVVFMVLVGRRFLPDNRSEQELEKIEAPAEIIQQYRLPENIFRLRVRKASILAGRTIASTDLRGEYEVNIMEIIRPVKPKHVVKLGAQQLVLQSSARKTIVPSANTVLERDDMLIVQMDDSKVAFLAAEFNLSIQPTERNEGEALITDEFGVAEVLLPPRSDMIGKTLLDTRFGSSHRLTVLGIKRPGCEEKLDLKETVFEFGDILLVQGKWKNILRLKKKRNDYVVLGQPEAMIGTANPKKAAIASVIMLGMLVLMVTGAASITAAAMIAALAVVLSGCLTMDEAYRAIDWKSVVLIAGMLPMSTALEKVGLVSIAAQALIESVGTLGPVALLGSIFLFTAIFTQVLSNTATTVLVAPIALAAAVELGVEPHAILMGVAIAASMAFASPVASPTNTLVMGAGNYRFLDFLKVGAPMILLTMIVTMLIVPLLWPF
ncbi:SLC13 family permease [Oligoflexia bacterium]|nr:SLC13 family permease [Oligoflexia bacterium]